MVLTSIAPRLRRAQEIAYLGDADTERPHNRTGVVVCLVNERYVLVRCSLGASSSSPAGEQHEVLVFRPGAGWVAAAGAPSRGGWIDGVAYALCDPEPDGSPVPAMGALLEERNAAERRLEYLRQVDALVNGPTELPEPPAAEAGTDVLRAALDAVERAAMQAHACLQREQLVTQARLERVDGAIVDREALLVDLGRHLLELRSRGAARRKVEESFVAAHQACAVDDDDAIEACGCFSEVAARYLRGVVAWWRVRTLVLQRCGAVTTQRAA